MVKKKEKKEINGAGTKAGLATFGILVLSVTVLLLVDFFIPFKRFNPRWLSMYSFSISIILSSTVVMISAYLLFVYLKDYFQLKSPFTLGIAFTIFAFLMFAVTSNPLIHNLLGVSGRSGIFSIIPMFFALISLLVLAWISSK